MSLYQAGEVPAEVLEVYRICATLDDEDPGALLAERGLTAPVDAGLPAEARLRDLLDEADRYLADFSGPGIAEVRRGLAEARRDVVTPRPGSRNPVVARHLPAALEALGADDLALAGAIAAAVPDLSFQSYGDYSGPALGAGFRDGHAFASLVGLDAPYPADDFDFGLFLIAPDTLYPDHRHAAPELYAPLTGPHGWRFAPGAPLVVKPAHQPIWNVPWAPHMTKTGPVPFLCLYAWTRDAQAATEILAVDDLAELQALKIE
jgi:hypothetical protein